MNFVLLTENGAWLFIYKYKKELKNCNLYRLQVTESLCKNIMERKIKKQEERLMLKYPETDTFIWCNENPKGHITGDCSIRALAGGMEIPWEDALNGLHYIEQKYALMDIKAIDKYLLAHGWVKQKQPKKENGKKYTGADFAKWLSVNYPNGEAGNVICSVANHMFCIKPTYQGDGINCRYKVHDTWDSTRKCINNFWIHVSFINKFSGSGS